MHDPAISIILPYFNASKTLERAITSILKQTFQDFQLLLVDNNSTDGSSDIAIKHAQNDQRIVFLEEERQGVVHAFNKGLSIAKSKYIARMDADDFAYPNRLLLQKNYLDAHSEVGLLGGKVRLAGDSNNLGFQHYVSWSNGIQTPLDIRLSQFIELPVINPTIMGHTKVFKQLGGYLNGDFPEDYDLILRALEKGIKIHKLDNIVLDWYDSPNRLTRTDPRYSPEAFFKLKATFITKWIQKNGIHRQDIWICGGGKLARRRSAFLFEGDLNIKGYIDVKKRDLPLPCILYDEIPDPGSIFIISFVSNRGKREEVRKHLLNKNYKEGIDFILAA